MVSLVYTGNTEIRFTSITHGDIILDGRDCPGSLVDRISSSFQKSLEGLMHYKFITAVRNSHLDVARWSTPCATSGRSPCHCAVAKNISDLLLRLLTFGLFNLPFRANAGQDAKTCWQITVSSQHVVQKCSIVKSMNWKCCRRNVAGSQDWQVWLFCSLCP